MAWAWQQAATSGSSGISMAICGGWRLARRRAFYVGRLEDRWGRKEAVWRKKLRHQAVGWNGGRRAGALAIPVIPSMEKTKQFKAATALMSGGGSVVASDSVGAIQAGVMKRKHEGGDIMWWRAFNSRQWKIMTVNSLY